MACSAMDSRACLRSVFVLFVVVVGLPWSCSSAPSGGIGVAGFLVRRFFSCSAVWHIRYSAYGVRVSRWKPRVESSLCSSQCWRIRTGDACPEMLTKVCCPRHKVALRFPEIGIVHPRAGFQVSSDDSDTTSFKSAFHFLFVFVIDPAALIFVQVELEVLYFLV